MRLIYLIKAIDTESWYALAAVSAIWLWTALVIILTAIVSHRIFIKGEEDRLPEKARNIIRGYKSEIRKLEIENARLNEELERMQARLNGARAWARLIEHRFVVATHQLVSITEGIKGGVK